MEHCEKSLCDLIEERHDDDLGPFPVECIMKIAIDIAKALDYLHTSLVLHGDIKSGNILVKSKLIAIFCIICVKMLLLLLFLDNFEIAKLCDFGVSLPLKSDGTLHKVRGCRAIYIGTSCWSAPEVLKGEECLGAIITNKADIFSYGLTLWEMMTLLVPNSGIEVNNSYYSGYSEDLDAHLGNFNFVKIVHAYN